MKNSKSLEDKYNVIKEMFSEQPVFIMSDVEKMFPELSRATIYWLMSELVKKGYIKRERRGMFSFNEWQGKKRISISKDAENLMNIMYETGFSFFISGLDILLKYMHHVPEQYPLMLFVEKEAKSEVKNILSENGYGVIAPIELKEKYEDIIYSGRKEPQVILYLTDSFEFAENGLASIEKAFVDTYYSVTRNGFPLSIQELVRIYENLVRLGNIDQRRTITIASKRSIQYDIRYIVESRYITEEARKFVEILRKDFG